MYRLLIAPLALLASGCGANHHSIHRQFSADAGPGRSQLIDAEQRAIVVTENGVCAEPSPDAIAAIASATSTGGSFIGKPQFGNINLDFGNASDKDVASIGLRTQSIQLMRDAYYRLCETYINTDDAHGYDILMRRFQNHMIAFLAIEQLTGAVNGHNAVLTNTSSVPKRQSGGDGSTGQNSAPNPPPDQTTAAAALSSASDTTPATGSGDLALETTATSATDGQAGVVPETGGPEGTAPATVTPASMTTTVITSTPATPTKPASPEKPTETARAPKAKENDGKEKSSDTETSAVAVSTSDRAQVRMIEAVESITLAAINRSWGVQDCYRYLRDDRPAKGTLLDHCKKIMIAVEQKDLYTTEKLKSEQKFQNFFKQIMAEKIAGIQEAEDALLLYIVTQGDLTGTTLNSLLTTLERRSVARNATGKEVKMVTSKKTPSPVVSVIPKPIVVPVPPSPVYLAPQPPIYDNRSIYQKGAPTSGSIY